MFLSLTHTHTPAHHPLTPPSHPLLASLPSRLAAYAAAPAKLQSVLAQKMLSFHVHSLYSALWKSISGAPRRERADRFIFCRRNLLNASPRRRPTIHSQIAGNEFSQKILYTLSTGNNSSYDYRFFFLFLFLSIFFSFNLYPEGLGMEWTLITVCWGAPSDKDWLQAAPFTGARAGLHRVHP